MMNTGYRWTDSLVIGQEPAGPAGHLQPPEVEYTTICHITSGGINKGLKMLCTSPSFLLRRNSLLILVLLRRKSFPRQLDLRLGSFPGAFVAWLSVNALGASSPLASSTLVKIHEPVPPYGPADKRVTQSHFTAGKFLSHPLLDEEDIFRSLPERIHHAGSTVILGEFHQVSLETGSELPPELSARSRVGQRLLNDP